MKSNFLAHILVQFYTEAFVSFYLRTAKMPEDAQE